MHVNQLIRSAVECQLEAPRFAFVAPYFKQAKAIAWDYMQKFAGAIPGAIFNQSELRVDLPGDRRVTLYGADNPDSIQGIYLDGTVMDEDQFIAPWIFRRVMRPMLADRKGWVVFSGKPYGKNHFYTRFRELSQRDGAVARLYRASETGYLDEEELRLLRADMTADEYAQELECSWEAAVPGAYYARELEAARNGLRIKPLVYERQVSVSTAWDLGWSDTTAVVFFQVLGREIHVIDYLEESHRDMPWWAKELQRKDYLYGSHLLPHDADAEQQSSGGKSLKRQLSEAGLQHLRVVPRTDNVLHDIQQVRRVFPRIWFDSVKTEPLVDALGSYHEKYDEKRKTFTGDPDHDWSSHAADAFRMLVMGFRDGGVAEPVRPSKTQFSPYQHLNVPRIEGPPRRPYITSLP